MSSSPFKFLDSYTKEDKEIFFGRDAEIEELYSRVFQSKLLLVYGLSGTGKSSLIHCGLSNKFNDSDWLPIMIRRAENINSSFSRTLKKFAITPVETEDGKELAIPPRKIIQSLYLDHFKPVYLIFDQFEELFIFGTTEEKEAFVKEVAKIVKSELQCKFIFIIREEYLATLTEFEEFLPDLFSNRLRIEKMTRLKAKDVVEKPCAVFNIGLEAGFADSLLQKLSPDKNEVELTYLQVYLDKIYRLTKQSANSNEKIVFTNKILDSTGSITDLLGSFLEEQITHLENPDQALTLLKAFVSTQGTKRQIDLAEAGDFSRTLGKNIEPQDIKNLVSQFVDLRILRDKDENGRYELRHDALALKIYEEITLLEKELLEVRQFIENAYSSFQKRNILLNQNDLLYIAPYKDKLFLSEELNDFLKESRKELSKKRRRTRNIAIAAAAVLLVVFAGFTFWALNERAKALKAMAEAEKQKNEAVAAKEAAELATQFALNATKEANQSKSMAEREKEVAEKARIEALTANQKSKEALLIAESSRLVAEQEKKNSELSKEKAIAEKEKAEKNRIEAENAQKKAMQLSMATLSQKLALKATLETGNKELQALLALHAYSFNDQINGRDNDPNIFKGLTKSMAASLGGDYNLCKPVQPAEPKILSRESTGSIFSVSNTGTVSSWDTKQMKLTSSRQINLGGLTPVSYWGEAGNGKYLVSGHDNNTIVLWVNDGSKYSKIEFPKNHTGLLRGVAFNDSFTEVYTGAKDGKIIKWKYDGKLSFVKEITLDAEIVVVCWIGNRLAYSLKNGKAGVLSQELNSDALNNSAGNPILAFAFDKNKKILYATTNNGSLLLFDTNNGNKLTKEIPVSKSALRFISIDPAQKYMITADNEKVISIFELQNLSLEPMKILEHIAMIRSVLCTGNKVYVGYGDNQIRGWEIESKVMKSRLCEKVTRQMTDTEWDNFVGKEIKYQKVCTND